LLLLNFTTSTQNILENIHPLFRGKLNGNLIRENYSFLYTHSPVVRNGNNKGLTESDIILGMFVSNRLTLTKQPAFEKLPEVKKWIQDTLGIITGTAGSYSRSYPIPVFDSTGIIVTANGINRENAESYLFRVVENKKKEIIPWRSIKLFCQAYLGSTRPDGTEETEVAYLGAFKSSFGNGLTIEIRKKTDPAILGSMSAIWINRMPSVLGVFSTNDMQPFLKVFKNQWQHDVFMELTPKERAAKDSQLVLKKIFNPEENNLIFYLDDKIKSKEIIEYNLVSGKKNGGWKPNDFDLNLIWLKNLSPGNYTLQMRYSIQRHNISSYEFSIDAAWHQTTAFKIITALLALGLIGFVVLLIRTRKQKQKLEREQLQKQQIQTELKSIHAQFNPHFVFNALNSIQGLITKNDMEGANRFLSEFSTLLRDSLKESRHEMVSLLTEIKMLDSYLMLEQLRFGFTYTIEVDDAIDRNAVEIPFLLLQPLIENAVKHGVSYLYDKGSLMINFKKSSQDMLILISDNGRGFNPLEVTTGYGMKLTRDRIVLLNKLLKGQFIELSINSSDKETVAHLIFKNWLS
jgi:two-component system LytT family sensor kinase